MDLTYAPFTPFMIGPTKTLPGISPMEMADWLHRDEAYAEQMAYRDKLVKTHRDVVFAETPEVAGPAGELLNLVKTTLAETPDHEVTKDTMTRPDGVAVPLVGDHPLALLARMTQEDFCILWRPEDSDEHSLIGAILCFPSRWLLSEKFGRPMIGIHEPVPNYNDGIAKRVQRLFDALRPDQPLVRANWLVHTSPELHQPLTEEAKAKWEKAPSDKFWLRTERQSLMRLPHSGAVVFTIKTCLTPIEALTRDQQTGLIDALRGTGEDMQVYHGGLSHHHAAIEALRAL